MSLSTHSKFYYGHTVDQNNASIDFDEGGGELQATLNTGEYTLTEYASEVARAMNEAGGQTYSTAVDRSSGKITISAASNFSLLVSSGSRLGTTAYTMAGFTGSDRSGSNSYEGDSLSGSSYSTQFILQDYIDKAHKKGTIDPKINKAASGRVELFGFGSEKFYQMNIKYVTDRNVGGEIIRFRANGVSDLVSLMDYLITKAPVEFMPDEDTPNTFDKVILESTPDERNGSGYELKELYGRGLPGFFETGIITLRVQE